MGVVVFVTDVLPVSEGGNEVSMLPSPYVPAADAFAGHANVLTVSKHVTDVAAVLMIRADAQTAGDGQLLAEPALDGSTC